MLKSVVHRNPSETAKSAVSLSFEELFFFASFNLLFCLCRVKIRVNMGPTFVRKIVEEMKWKKCSFKELTSIFILMKTNVRSIILITVFGLWASQATGIKSQLVCFPGVFIVRRVFIWPWLWIWFQQWTVRITHEYKMVLESTLLQILQLFEGFSGK